VRPPSRRSSLEQSNGAFVARPLSLCGSRVVPTAEQIERLRQAQYPPSSRKRAIAGLTKALSIHSNASNESLRSTTTGKTRRSRSSTMPSYASTAQLRPTPSAADPLASALGPPPDETPGERAERTRAEQAAKKRSEEIDKTLKEDASRKRRETAGEQKMLLLGEWPSDAAWAAHVTRADELTFRQAKHQAARPRC